MSNLKFREAVANSGAMEANTISKNGRSLKSQMSRGDFLKKACFALLTAGAMISGCNKDDSGREKLLKTITMSDGTFNTFEYDNQNRSTKVTSSKNGTHDHTSIRTYNAGGDLTKYEYKHSNPSNDYTVEFVKSADGNTITITRKRSGQSDVISTLSVNSNGYPTKHEEYRSGTRFERTYDYVNGNLTKTSEIRIDNMLTSVVEYEYDNMKSINFNNKIQKWFMIWDGGVAGSQNNMTKRTSYYFYPSGPQQGRSSIDYTYEYDSDKFPTRRTNMETDGTKFEILYGYK